MSFHCGLTNYMFTKFPSPGALLVRPAFTAVHQHYRRNLPSDSSSKHNKTWLIEKQVIMNDDDVGKCKGVPTPPPLPALQFLTTSSRVVFLARNNVRMVMSS